MELWSSKNAVRELLSTSAAIVLFEWNGRTRTPHFKLLVPIAPRRDYAGEFLCLDTAIDPATYSSLAPGDLCERFTCGPVHRPICPVRLNKMPIVFDISDPLVAQCMPGNVSALVDRVRPLLADTAFHDRMMAAAELRNDRFAESPYVEKQLYSGGFIGDADSFWLAEFHRAAADQKLAIVARLSDTRLRTLAVRIIYEEWPSALSVETAEQVASEIRARLHASGKCHWTTYGTAVRDIDELLANSDERGRATLSSYRQFIVTMSGLTHSAR